MLKKLFGDNGSGARTPEGMRLYAIGDIHGCSDLLDTLMDAISADSEKFDGETRLIFLGDYIDRGPDSRGVIERLLETAAARPNAAFIKGNHEAAMLDFLADPWGGEEWLSWGGAETLHSYGVTSALGRDPEDVAADARERLPKPHLDFLESLDLTHLCGDYFFVHAGVKPGTPLTAQAESDLLWIRSEFHNTRVADRPDKVVVHGHHPMKKPLDAGWRIAVDTGACFTGRLTAVVLEGTERWFLST